METHRLLTFVGAVLLVVTFFLNNSYVENNSISPDIDKNIKSDTVNDLTSDTIEEFNYAYVTGAVMIGAFIASFVFFTKNKAKRGLLS